MYTYRRPLTTMLRSTMGHNRRHRINVRCLRWLSTTDLEWQRSFIYARTRYLADFEDMIGTVPCATDALKQEPNTDERSN